MKMYVLDSFLLKVFKPQQSHLVTPSITSLNIRPLRHCFLPAFMQFHHSIFLNYFFLASGANNFLKKQQNTLSIQLIKNTVLDTPKYTKYLP